MDLENDYKELCSNYDVGDPEEVEHEETLKDAMERHKEHLEGFIEKLDVIIEKAQI